MRVLKAKDGGRFYAKVLPKETVLPSGIILPDTYKGSKYSGVEVLESSVDWLEKGQRVMVDVLNGADMGGGEYFFREKDVVCLLTHS